MQPEFHEIQRFNKWWHYLIAGLPVLLTAGVGLSFYTSFAPKLAESGSWHLLLIGAIILGTLLSFVWFLLLKLETRIDAAGISVRFHGLPFCKRTIAWHDIKSISVINYSPLSDYGGWGVRYSLTGNGWCYNVSGDKGIKLFYQNGKPFLIGTQQSEHAGSVINYYFKS